MSIRSRIAILEKDGKVKSVYCHSNGYPTYQGELLLKHYNSEAKAREIISLGDLNLLDVNLHPKGTEHSFLHPQAGVTIAYHRDRKEPLVIKKNGSLDKYEKTNSFSVVLYNYLWKDGKWFVFDSYKTKQWLVLTKHIIEQKLW